MPKRPAVERTSDFSLWGPPMAAAEAFADELKSLGYTAGRNLTIEYWWVVSFDRLGEEAAELAKHPLDAIVVVSTPAAFAAKAATKTIPGIMAASADPVGRGVVQSLAHPGANVTGLALMNPDLTGKRIALLRLALPRLEWLAALHRGQSAFPIVAAWLEENAAAARRFDVRFFDAEIAAEVGDWEAGVLAIAKRLGTAATVLEDPTLVANAGAIPELLLKHRLPAVFPFREHVEGGGLLSYGVDLSSLFRRAAHYLDRVLRGASPASLPIEQPTKFELAVNLGTEALGPTLPRSLLVQADHVLE